MSLQVHVMESGHVRGGLWPVQKRSDKVQYFLEHHNGFFYILTNAPLEGTETTNGGYYLARCRAEKSEMDKWQVYLSLCLCLALRACVYVFVGKEWGGGESPVHIANLMKKVKFKELSPPHFENLLR